MSAHTHTHTHTHTLSLSLSLWCVRACVQYLYDFLDATITRQASPEEAFRRFDDMAVKHTEKLRTLTRQVQEARQQSDEDAVKRFVNAYDDAIERYIPVLMAQAKIYWDMKNYVQVEKVSRHTRCCCARGCVCVCVIVHLPCVRCCPLFLSLPCPFPISPSVAAPISPPAPDLPQVC